MKLRRKLMSGLLLAGVVMAGAQSAMMSMKANPMVGGMPMMASKNIVQNAVESADHTTLVAAVKAAGLVDALMGKGPFTVFAPTNAAFSGLPKGAVENLLLPENMKTLQGVLTYHVVSGKMDYDAIAKAIKAGGGSAKLKTLNGGWLWAMWNGPRNIVLKDEMGNLSAICTYDVMQSNGVIHVIDHVLMPK